MEELAWRELREGREQRAAGWARRASTLPQTPGLKGLALIPTSPTAHTTLDLSTCVDVELSPDGASLLCLADGQQTYLNVETGAVRWQRPLPTVPDWFVSPEGVVLVSNNNLLSIANDGSQRDLGYLRQLDVVAVHDDRVIIHNGDRHGVPTPGGGPLLPTIPSQARTNFLWSNQDDTWWVGGRHNVLQIDPVSGAVLQSIDHHLGEHLLAILPVPEGFLAMGMRGTYRTYAWSGQPLGLPEHLAHAGLVSDAVSNGPWLATNGAKSGVQLWNRHTGARIRQVQPAPARALSMTEHALLVANEHLDSVPLEGRGQAWEVTGLASIARRGEEIWATVGGEIVGLLPDARQQIPLPGFGTVKTVVPFEGGWLVAGVGHPVSTTGHRVPAGLQAVVLRDLVALADGWMVGAPFTGGPEVVRADEHRSEFQRPSQSYRRMVVSHDRRSVVLVTDAGEVERLLITAAGEPTKERIGSFPGVRFGVPVGDETWLFMVDGEVRRSNREAPDWTFDGKLTAVAVDDRYLYLGTADGLVEIRNFEGQLLARLRAHDELVCTLLPDGDDLFTASWDSTIRRFDLSKL
jgi:WD40 repeat protein